MENTRLYASVGLALQMGCLMAVLALVALGAGMFIDRTFLNGGRLATFVCIVGSIPFNLFLALRLTQLLIKRIIPPIPEKPGKTATAAEEAEYKNLGQ